MSDRAEIKGKIIFFETVEEHIPNLRQFLVDNHLVGLKVRHFRAAIELVKGNVDLGVIILSEVTDDEGESYIEAARTIHQIRPELPIFLACSEVKEVEGLPVNLQKVVAATYPTQDQEELKELIEKYLFNTYFPASFIRGIEELSEEAILVHLRNAKIFTCAPYLIRSNYVYGKVCSMMPLESPWCRGYMLLQIEKARINYLIQQGRTAFAPGQNTETIQDGLLSEMTNMVWGRFKSRFFTEHHSDWNHILSQVPVIIDQESNYISFGSRNPQLCFRYVVYDEHDAIEPVSIYQKFVFHLNWSPEEFKEPNPLVDDLVKAGELELF